MLCYVPEVFFLFGLYDYDRSGFLDGLEMMKLLSDFNSHHIPGAEASEQVSRSDSMYVCIWTDKVLAFFIQLAIFVYVCMLLSGGFYGRFLTTDSGSKPGWSAGSIWTALPFNHPHTGTANVLEILLILLKLYVVLFTLSLYLTAKTTPHHNFLP